MFQGLENRIRALSNRLGLGLSGNGGRCVVVSTSSGLLAEKSVLMGRRNISFNESCPVFPSASGSQGSDR
jgi:hypothetical protein